MKFFLDTANVDEVKELASTGLIDGITTNPSLVLKSGQSFTKVIEEMCKLIPGPVSAEVVALDAEKMVEEGRKLSRIAPNVTVKVPLTPHGLKACYTLRREGIMVNVTLCFSPVQALLAAKAGASFISPFVGRLDDCGHDGMDLIADIREIYDNYPDFETQILAASIRHPLHVVQAAKLGADICTVPPSIMHQLFKHPLTDKGLETFLKDWEKTGQII